MRVIAFSHKSLSNLVHSGLSRYSLMNSRMPRRFLTNIAPPKKPILTPLECGWMSKAVYAQLNDINVISINEPHRRLLAKGWKLNHFVAGCKENSYYQGAVYVHNENKIIAVAHGGTSLTRLGTLDADWTAVINNKIHPQIINALTLTLTPNIRDMLVKQQFSLMFTGHSLGGFLATLSTYFCQRSDLGYYFTHSRAVVFDPAGSQDIMMALEPHAHSGQRLGQEGIANLDIMHFLSYPNYVNAFRPHPGGTIYALTSPEIDAAIRDTQNNPKVYLEKTHGLENLLFAFDNQTGYPKDGCCQIAIDWPLIDLNDLKRLKSGIGQFEFLYGVGASLVRNLGNTQQETVAEWKKLLGGEEFQHAAWLAIQAAQQASSSMPNLREPHANHDLETLLRSRRIFSDRNYDRILRLCHLDKSVVLFLKDLDMFRNLPLVDEFFEHHELDIIERQCLMGIILEQDKVVMQPDSVLNVMEWQKVLQNLVDKKGTKILHFKDFILQRFGDISSVTKTLEVQSIVDRERIAKIEEWFNRINFELNNITKQNLKKFFDSLSLNTFYVPRKNIIKKIDDSFSLPNINAVKFVLYGVAGVGKTQIARQYYINNLHAYTVAFYFNADNKTKLVNEYEQKLRKYKQQSVFGDEKTVIRDFIEWIEQFPRSLLVYDNVEDHLMLDSMLPSSGQHKILITSRVKNGLNRAEVPLMTAQESINLFGKILIQEGEDEIDINLVCELAKELCYLPLAITQACALITAKEMPMTLREFLEKFKQNKKILLLSEVSLPWESAAHHSMYITWQLAKQKLILLNMPWEFALQVVSILPPDNMQQKMIEDGSLQIIRAKAEEKYNLTYRDIDSFLSTLFISVAIASIMVPPIYYLVLAAIDSEAVMIFFISCFVYYFFPSLIIYIQNILKENYIEKNSKNIVGISECLKNLGLIREYKSHTYTVHRLTQEMLQFDLGVLGIKSAMALSDVLSESINVFFNNKEKSRDDLFVLFLNVAFLLSHCAEIKNFLPFSIFNINEYTVFHTNSSGGLGGSDIDIATHLMKVAFYNDIFSGYIKLNLQLVKILIYLDKINECHQYIDEIGNYLLLFYSAPSVATENQEELEIFFRQTIVILRNINYYLHCKMAEKNSLFEASDFNATWQKLTQLDPTNYVETGDLDIATLKEKLKNFLSKNKQSGWFDLFFDNDQYNAIFDAQQAIKELPFFSKPSNYLKSTYSRNKKEKLLSASGKSLYDIFEEHYPLILEEDAEIQNKKIMKWWLEYRVDLMQKQTRTKIYPLMSYVLFNNKFNAVMHDKKDPSMSQGEIKNNDYSTRI